MVDPRSGLLCADDQVLRVPGQKEKPGHYQVLPHVLRRLPGEEYKGGLRWHWGQARDEGHTTMQQLCCVYECDVNATALNMLATQRIMVSAVLLAD